MLLPYEYCDDNEGYLPDENLSESVDSKGHKKYFCVFRTQWILWRCVSAFMGFFFFAAAFVQHNDPDPYLWVPAYTIPCIVSLAVAFGLTVKKYKPLPTESSSASSPSCSTSSTPAAALSRSPSNVNNGINTKSGHGRVQALNTDVVIIPKYGSANTKLNWLINIHIIYCFMLGIWTLAAHLYGLQANQDKDQEKKRVETTKVFNHTLHMDADTEEAKELMGLCLIIAWLSLLRRNNYVLLGKKGLLLGIALTVIPVVAWICVELFEDSSCN